MYILFLTEYKGVFTKSIVCAFSREEKLKKFLKKHNLELKNEDEVEGYSVEEIELGKEPPDFKPFVKDIEYSPIPSYGDKMSIEMWKECVKEGMFIDYDGHGHLATNKFQMNLIVVPSFVDKRRNRIRKCVKIGEDYSTKVPEHATHVIWYNK